MNLKTASNLIDINRRFYADFGASFAATRQRIQNGVRRVLGTLPDDPSARWLDIGCGSGSLAGEWLRAGRRSHYLGLDFSSSLLAEAEKAVQELPSTPGQVAFRPTDLASPTWAEGLEPGFSGVLAFAVLHHIPGRDLRLAILNQVRGLLAPGGVFIHSEWQFQHSPKLMERRLPWSTVGLAEMDVEPGDTLLDWRAAQPGQPEQTGLRYVHLFSHEELAELTFAAGFHMVEEFESDGQGGRLGLYQVWKIS
jgi:tRNA (uracil-5-)-methyltransferase TRM9